MWASRKCASISSNRFLKKNEIGRVFLKFRINLVVVIDVSFILGRNGWDLFSELYILNTCWPRMLPSWNDVMQPQLLVPIGNALSIHTLPCCSRTLFNRIRYAEMSLDFLVCVFFCISSNSSVNSHCIWYILKNHLIVKCNAVQFMHNAPGQPISSQHVSRNISALDPVRLEGQLLKSG